MKGRSLRSIGNLQLRIMKVLWKRQGSTVHDVQTSLEQEGDSHAYTTIATMLRKMEERGLVEHNKEGRQFIYHPSVTDKEVKSGVVGDILDRLFLGSLTGMVSQLMSQRKVSIEELEDLEKLIARKKKQLED